MVAEKKQRRDIEPIMAISFVVFLLASVAVLSVFVYDNYLSADDESVIGPGSKVTVDYTGSLYNFYYEDGALIFDTNVKDHAQNDQIIKVGGFSKTSFFPLTVTPGSGAALAAFENALIGHKAGDVVKVEIPAGQGYVSQNKKISNEFSIEFIQYFDASAFEKMYNLGIVNGAAPITFTTIYGWEATAVYDTIKDKVKVTNNPTDPEYVLKSNALNSDTGSNAKMMVNSSGTKIVCTLSVVGTGDYMVWVDLGYESFYIYGDDGASLLKITSDPATEGIIYFVITIKSVE